MSWKIWKRPLERAEEEFGNGYRKGLNLSNWNSAFSSFNSAYELYKEAGDIGKAQVALALAVFSKALSEPQKIENWDAASNSLKVLGNIEINVTEPILAEMLSQECELRAFELKARRIENITQRSEQLEEAAKKYISIGKHSLLVSLLLEKEHISGQIRAHRIIAEAAKLRGDEIIDLNPKSASELYRMAAIHMKAAGDLESFQHLSTRADDFSVTAQCYFCGREVQGKEINFVHMKANLTRYLGKQTESQVLPSTLSKDSVVACQGCYSAITFAADEIAKKYFDILESKLAEFRAFVEGEIRDLKSKIGYLESRVRMRG